ncbi:MAG: T9SS type A sorting domain-containing protein, partial [Chitinophagales bacterium]
IANWPGNGPAGFEEIMAPFADLNNNGLYEPSLGDYPSIYGDQAVYYIFNDIALAHTETGADPLGFEVHGMAYAFNEGTNPILENSIFFNYSLKNKSLNNYHELYFGLWNDFDMGCAEDDYVGTDVAKNSIFVINQDSIDGEVGCSVYYGVNPPALAATWLSHPLSSSIGYSNDFGPNTGNPETAGEYYNYTKGLWGDGSPMMVDSLHPNGYGGTDTSQFFFPGFSDSSASGQPSNWWWDAGPGPSDMRIVGSIGPFNIASQGTLNLDFAYNFLPNNGSDENGEGRLALSNSVQTIIDLYKNGTILSAEEPATFDADIMISPNPFHDFATIKFNGKFESFQVMDVTGRIVLQQQVDHQSSITLNRNELPNGVYLLQLSSKSQQFTSKIIIK